MSEDVVEVVENGINTRELIEHADGHSQEDREPVFPGEQGLIGSVLQINGLHNVLQFLFKILFAG